jgi:mono/diheme cytochrome c family protein
MPPLRKNLDEMVLSGPGKKAGCPIFARFVRKGGKARTSISPVLIFLALTMLSGCRLDMHVQPRENPLSRSDFFTDQRSARPLVEGTVARGQLHADSYLYSGKAGNAFGDYMPFPATKEVMERGRERYNIFCAPCHSRVGDGNGFVVSRGFNRKPPSYHIPRLQKAPLGYFYDVISNGYGIMPDYASQIPPHDRWAIVAYVRALQLSQNATMAEVPAGQKVPSEPPRFGDSGTGATLPIVAPAVDAQSTSEGEKHEAQEKPEAPEKEEAK